MARIILTGFRAFPGVADNPTQTLIEHFRADPSALPGDTALHLLDVDYRSIGAAIDIILTEPPAALILTGYSNLATDIRLESRATGLCAPDKPDVCGYVPQAPLSAPETLHTRLDLTRLQTGLEARAIPASISRDAGQYLCNYSYRHALSVAAMGGMSTQVVFVHFPAVEGTALAQSAAAAMPLGQMAAALSHISAELADISAELAG